MTTEPSDTLASRIVQAALADLRPLLPPGAQLGSGPEAPLAHPEGPLDSLGIVNLVATVEGLAAREGAGSVGLLDALALPLEESPFRTVGTLTAWIASAPGVAR